MHLLAIFMCLAVVLHQSVGQRPALGFTALFLSTADNHKVIVDKYNDLRRNVSPTASNMLKMEWDPDVAASAQRWASKCQNTISPEGETTVRGVRCGETILQSSKPASWSAVIQYWYDRVKYFKYGVGGTDENESFNTYTQVVWYSSYQIGCSVAYCPNNQFNYFYVCHYCPAGNIVEHLATPYKEGPKCGDCPHACENGLCTNPCRFRDADSDCSTLKELFGCNDMVKEKCPATCKCTTEIK
ncbi:PREDICTED: serotriflin-like [Crocodylus porosus]|uniref:serotriflin-like n=1 Tax=Crocodylus porosus TaxID=8502 RepID=UPI00093DEF89|nr:PREDICTED: serotriflin-like [Crocodylus porosus]